MIKNESSLRLERVSPYQFAIVTVGSGDEQRHRRRYFSAVATSLSPRPEQFITMILSADILGATFAMCATACAVSSAGMMPSVSDNNLKPASASSSVAKLYSTRPI